MITVILAVGFTAVSIAALLQVRENKKLKHENGYYRIQVDILDEVTDLMGEANKDIMEGVYYHPETDTLVPFEDLRYMGEF